MNYIVSIHLNWRVEDVKNEEEAKKEVIKGIDFMNNGITIKDFTAKRTRWIVMTKLVDEIIEKYKFCDLEEIGKWIEYLFDVEDNRKEVNKIDKIIINNIKKLSKTELNWLWNKFGEWLKWV